jgi:hypothetical protein
VVSVHVTADSSLPPEKVLEAAHDWSEPGVVKAAVIDSNVLRPGSTFDVRATPSDVGSKVEFVLNRDFQPGVKGRIASAVNHGFGDRWRRFGWSRMLQQVLGEAQKSAATS